MVGTIHRLEAAPTLGPNEAIVEMCEALLKFAKEGKLTAIVFAGLLTGHDNVVGLSDSVYEHPYYLMGLLAHLNITIEKGMKHD